MNPTSSQPRMPSDFIPYGRHDITQADVDAVVQVLRGANLTQGPEVPAFEEGICRQLDVPYVMAVSNGTAALHLAMLALGVGPGDEVIIPPITFVASGNSALYCGADVSFVDIDAETFCLSPRALRDELEMRKETGRKLPKVIVNVLLAGETANAEAIHRIAREFGIFVVEDACHALGGQYSDGRPAASGHLSDISILSFHPVKHVATGEGGAVTTRDPVLAKKVRELRTHGITRESFTHASASDGFWYYEMQTLGFNYRLTDIQAALGRSQISRLPQFIARRRNIAAHYDRTLGALAPVLLTPSPSRGHAFHLYVLQLDFEKLGRTRARVMERLKSRGIGTQVHYIPVYRQPYYRRRLGLRTDQDASAFFAKFPVSEKYYRQCMSLPMYSAMSDSDVECVITEVKRELEGS